jgi:sugar O-acyltransferase (sialic acid O-acetyltransferase NeuD family)
MLKRILLVGCGGHAKACIETIESQNLFSIFGLIGMPNEIGGSILGYPIIGSDTDLFMLRSEVENAHISLGHMGNHSLRKKMYDLCDELNFTMPPIISSSALTSRFSLIGEGSIIMAGAIVNAGAHIGKNCIINSKALIEHDVEIQDNCHISTGAIVNGGVIVGEGAFIGSGSILKNGLKIGRECFIGMGTLVKNDLHDLGRNTKS